MVFRGFSGEHEQPAVRDVEDAPVGLRAELADLLFALGADARLAEQHVYETIGRSLGVNVPGNPMSSRATRAANVMAQAAWPRIFDLILRFVPEFARAGHFEAFRDGVNRLLAGYQIAWDLDDNGRLIRVMPGQVIAIVRAAVQELSVPRFAPALTLFNSARDAYDARPRRDRDACANEFDCMESVAKEKHAMPHDTFGQVVRHVRQSGAQNAEIVSVLEALNTLRNRNFGHGMTAPFALTGPQVDFTYLSCIASTLLFVRTP